jgi:hypothetical protein
VQHLLQVQLLQLLVLLLSLQARVLQVVLHLLPAPTAQQ